MDLQDAYYLGRRFQYLQRAPFLNAKVKGEGLILDNLLTLSKSLESFKMSGPTQGDITRLIKSYEESYEEDVQLNDSDKRQLLEKTKIWNDRIANELAERKIIEIFVDGTLNSKKLIVGASTFFPNEIWVMLSDIAKSDLNDACNCLLTKSWTPAVMISLRAAEDCMRRLYRFKTGKETRNKGWKTILDDLEKLGSVNKNIMGYLNYLREIRNRSEHPDEIFDQLEAERVFHQIVNMIHVINKEMFLTRPFNKLSLIELKCISEIKNLKTSGKKEDLIKRLEEKAKP